MKQWPVVQKRERIIVLKDNRRGDGMASNFAEQAGHSVTSVAHLRRI